VLVGKEVLELQEVRYEDLPSESIMTCTTLSCNFSHVMHQQGLAIHILISPV
jgi:hypothetical protein